MSVFAHPSRLWLLAFAPMVLVWILKGWRRRRSDWRTLGQGGRLLADGALGWFGAMACLVLALAQPRWGLSTASVLPPGHDVVLLMDVSRSMGAEDAVPNRMGVAVESAESLLTALGRGRGNRVAVVAFEGRGVIRCPLTENLGAAVDTLRSLRPGSVKPGGTNLGAALEAGIDAFDSQDHAEGRTIVLFSDGEDHANTWSTTFDRLRAMGVVVHSVAIGDIEQGHPVPSLGQGPGAMTYRGTPVLSKRDDRPFEALAKTTGGALVPLGLAPADLGNLYVTKIAPVARQKREAIRPSERTERFGIFLGAALGFGLVGSWPGRGRWPRSYRWFLSLGALMLIAADPVGDRLAKENGDGRSAYAGGRFAEALAAFERAIGLAPKDPVPRFNAAAALFQLGRYPDAQGRYREARDRAGAALQTKIDYALGNTSLVLGDIPAAVAYYDACLASTANGPGLDAVRLDAAINRQFAEKQAKTPPVPPDPQGDSQSPAGRSRAPKPSGDEEGGANDSGNPDDSGGGGDDPRRGPPSGRRGPGGAGGTGSPSAKGDSPEQRLAAALENVRESRHRRIDEETSAPDKDRMDW